MFNDYWWILNEKKRNMLPFLANQSSESSLHRVLMTIFHQEETKTVFSPWRPIDFLGLSLITHDTLYRYASVSVLMTLKRFFLILIKRWWFSPFFFIEVKVLKKRSFLLEREMNDNADNLLGEKELQYWTVHFFIGKNSEFPKQKIQLEACQSCGRKFLAASLVNYK